MKRSEMLEIIYNELNSYFEHTDNFIKEECSEEILERLIKNGMLAPGFKAKFGSDTTYSGNGWESEEK